MKKIEQQELEQLRTLNGNFSSLKSRLADLEIANHNLQSQKNQVFTEMDNLSTEFKSLEAELLEKYGNVKVNLETGEIQDDKD